MASDSQVGVLDSRVSLVQQHVTDEPVPEYDSTVKEVVVETDPNTGHVTRVTLDEHVTADSPKAVQIPPQADGTTNNTLGPLQEPTPEQVFGTPSAGDHPDAAAVAEASAPAPSDTAQAQPSSFKSDSSAAKS